MLFLQSAGEQQQIARQLALLVQSLTNSGFPEQQQAVRRFRLDRSLTVLASELQPVACKSLTEIYDVLDFHEWSRKHRSAVSLAVFLSQPQGPGDMGIRQGVQELPDHAMSRELLEAIGIVFLFNMINRVADARHVPLEFAWLRRQTRIQKLCDVSFTSITRFLYDLTPIEMPLSESRELPTRLRRQPLPEFASRLSLAPFVADAMFELLVALLEESSRATDFSGAWQQRLIDAMGIGFLSSSDSTKGSVADWVSRHLLSQPDWMKLADSSPMLKLAWLIGKCPSGITSAHRAVVGLDDAHEIDLVLAASIGAAVGRTFMPAGIITQSVAKN